MDKDRNNQSVEDEIKRNLYSGAEVIASLAGHFDGVLTTAQDMAFRYMRRRVLQFAR